MTINKLDKMISDIEKDVSRPLKSETAYVNFQEAKERLKKKVSSLGKTLEQLGKPNGHDHEAQRKLDFK